MPAGVFPVDDGVDDEAAPVDDAVPAVDVTDAVPPTVLPVVEVELVTDLVAVVLELAGVLGAELEAAVVVVFDVLPAGELALVLVVVVLPVEEVMIRLSPFWSVEIDDGLSNHHRFRSGVLIA